MVKFEDIFDKPWPLIGMIHLNGSSEKDRLMRAIYEMQVYNDEGFDGVIIENYHGSVEDVERTLDVAQNIRTNLVKGVNILGNPYRGFEIAQNYGARFVQFDSVNQIILKQKYIMS